MFYIYLQLIHSVCKSNVCITPNEYIKHTYSVYTSNLGITFHVYVQVFTCLLCQGYASNFPYNFHSEGVRSSYIAILYWMCTLYVCSTYMFSTYIECMYMLDIYNTLPCMFALNAYFGHVCCIQYIHWIQTTHSMHKFPNFLYAISTGQLEKYSW